MNGNGLFDTQFTLNNASSFGIGANIGAIYKLSDMVRFSVSYTTKQSMDEFEWNTDMGKVSAKMNGVEQAAFGIAVSPSKNLTIELNERWLRWSDVLDKIDMKLEGVTFVTWQFGWDDQWVTSLGVTYIPSVLH
jgi:long-chain fatty acid transport protein